MDTPTISIIIPTYNECESIVPLISKLLKIIAAGRKAFEILVIDDDSPDGTSERVRQRFKNDVRVRCLIRRSDRGLGKSILYGIQKARGNIIIGMDADGNHDPAVIPLLLSKLSQADLVVASRFIRGGGMEDNVRYMTSFWFNMFLRFWFKFPIWDNTSGFYAIRRATLNALGPESLYFGYGEYHVRLVYKAFKAGMSIIEVPVFYKNRLSGQSKSRLPTMVATYVQTAQQLYNAYQ